jgi:alkaline phosphatase D
VAATLNPPHFDYGVASGDPLADRVILWTHAQFAGLSDDVAVDLGGRQRCCVCHADLSGSARATAAAGHTVKVDASGLSAGKDYYFRFRWDQHSSPVGKTRTLPAAGATSLALAVLTCSNYPQATFTSMPKQPSRQPNTPCIWATSFTNTLPMAMPVPMRLR